MADSAKRLGYGALSGLTSLPSDLYSLPSLIYNLPKYASQLSGGLDAAYGAVTGQPMPNNIIPHGIDYPDMSLPGQNTLADKTQALNDKIRGAMDLSQPQTLQDHALEMGGGLMVPIPGAAEAEGIGDIAKLASTVPNDAHAIAQANAVKMLGLASDNTALERAAAMGFDTDMPIYHGTKADVPAFDRNLIGTNTGIGGGALWATDTPDKAWYFANHGGMTGTENILPMYARSDFPRTINADGIEHVLNRNDKQEIRTMMNNGTDQVTLNKSIDGDNIMGRVMAIKNPNQLRSIFAAFDPALKDSSDLISAKPYIAPAVGLGALTLGANNGNG